ncbi:MAG TPA: HPF/RaiA family ribosome-associated protein [Thermoanaerobaculia bacterium]|nr:HPF/RaiA family ribosome-associated protein [Thermoanaerobaculia bacterium]
MSIQVHDDSFTPLGEDLLRHAEQRIAAAVRRFHAVCSASVTLARMESFAEASMCRVRIEWAGGPPLVVTHRDRDLKKAIDDAAETTAQLLGSRARSVREALCAPA